MQINVHFWSYFADIAGTRDLALQLPEATTVGEAMALIYQRFPTLETARKSTLIAVGVDYASADQALKDGEELSLFPPVQGG